MKLIICKSSLVLPDGEMLKTDLVNALWKVQSSPSPIIASNRMVERQVAVNTRISNCDMKSNRKHMLRANQIKPTYKSHTKLAVIGYIYEWRSP